MYTLKQGKIIDGMDGWYVEPGHKEAHYLYERSLLCSIHNPSWSFGYEAAHVRGEVSYCPQCRRRLTLMSATILRRAMREHSKGERVIVTRGHFRGRVGKVQTCGSRACCVLLDGDRIATTFLHNEIKRIWGGNIMLQELKEIGYNEWMKEGFTRIDAIHVTTNLIQGKIPSIDRDDAGSLAVSIVDDLCSKFDALAKLHTNADKEFEHDGQTFRLIVVSVDDSE